MFYYSGQLEICLDSDDDDPTQAPTDEQVREFVETALAGTQFRDRPAIVVDEATYSVRRNA